MIDLTNEELGYSLLSVSIIGNQPYTFPTLINTYNLELTFESTNPAVATVNTDGEVSIVENGTTTINAIFAGNEEYNAKTISYVLTVNVKKYLDYEGLKAFKQEIDKIIEDNEKITSAALNVLNKQTIKLNNTIEENEEVTSTALNDLHDRVDDIMGSYQSDWNQDDNTNPSYIKNKPTLGTASEKDVPTSGNASSTQVVLGNDSRLSDSRPASDVSEWAKQSTKPTYTKSEIGLGNVTNDSQVKRSEIGVANGVAELDSNGKVPSSQLPSFVDDIIEGYLYNDHFYAEVTHINLVTDKTGASTDRLTGKIYLDVSTDKTYRWSGSAYTQIKGDITLGETSSTAYRGDRGKIAYDHSQSSHARTDATKVESSSTNGNIKINDTETTVYTHPGSGTNPHGTTKNDVGLGNVGNFKAVSTVALLGLSSTEQSNARANIGAGTSSFSGSYDDLSNKPSSLPANGGNADTVDGYHASSFVPKFAGTGSVVYYHNSCNNWSGVKIVIPGGYNAWMMAFTLRIYTGYQYTDIVISGYHYGDAHWYLPAARVIGGTLNFRVVMGYEGDTANSLYVWFGYTSGNLSYGGFSIMNLHSGHNEGPDWYSGWIVSDVAYSSLTNKLYDYDTVLPSMENHTHTWDSITSKPSALGSATLPVYWNGSGFTNCTAYENASVNYATSAGNADTVDNLHGSDLVKFYLSPLAGDAPADSAKSWFVNTMPSSSAGIVYNVPGAEKTIIAGKSSGAYGHMLQIGYVDTYLRILRYQGGGWISTDWEKISAGYADSAGNADTIDGYHIAVVSSMPASPDANTIYIVK